MKLTVSSFTRFPDKLRTCKFFNILEFVVNTVVNTCKLLCVIEHD